MSAGHHVLLTQLLSENGGVISNGVSSNALLGSLLMALATVATGRPDRADKAVQTAHHQPQRYIMPYQAATIRLLKINHLKFQVASRKLLIRH